VDRYLVLRCPKCRKIITADGLNKKRTCPLCSHEIELRKVRVLFSSPSPRSAALAAQHAMERDTKARGEEKEFDFSR